MSSSERMLSDLQSATATTGLFNCRYLAKYRFCLVHSPGSEAGCIFQISEKPQSPYASDGHCGCARTFICRFYTGLLELVHDAEDVCRITNAK